MFECGRVIAFDRGDERGDAQSGHDDLRVAAFTRPREQHIDVLTSRRNLSAVHKHGRTVDPGDDLELAAAVALLPAHDLVRLAEKLLPLAEVEQRPQTLAALPHLWLLEPAALREVDHFVPLRSCFPETDEEAEAIREVVHRDGRAPADPELVAELDRLAEVVEATGVAAVAADGGTRAQESDDVHRLDLGRDGESLCHELLGLVEAVADRGAKSGAAVRLRELGRRA
jgi:hypothetical protein